MKKIKNWWKSLFHKTVYLDPRVTDPAKYLHVVELNPDSRGMFEALGITEERGRELHSLTIKAYVGSTNIVSVGEIISKECRHANEFFFAMTALHHHHQKMNSGGLLAHILRQGNQD